MGALSLSVSSEYLVNTTEIKRLLQQSIDLSNAIDKSVLLNQTACGSLKSCFLENGKKNEALTQR